MEAVFYYDGEWLEENPKVTGPMNQAFWLSSVVFDGAEGDGHGPEGARGVARVPDSQIEDTVEAAEECPGECIMIEPYNAEDVANRL